MLTNHDSHIDICIDVTEMFLHLKSFHFGHLTQLQLRLYRKSCNEFLKEKNKIFYHVIHLQHDFYIATQTKIRLNQLFCKLISLILNFLPNLCQHKVHIQMDINDLETKSLLIVFYCIIVIFHWKSKRLRKIVRK